MDVQRILLLGLIVVAITGCTSTRIHSLETPQEWISSSFVSCQPENVSQTSGIISGDCSRQMPQHAAFRDTVATIWTAFGPRMLGDLPGGEMLVNAADPDDLVEVRNSTALSATMGEVTDGEREVVVVGHGSVDHGRQAFYWTPSHGLVDMGYITAGRSTAWDIGVTPGGVEPDKVFIVGENVSRGFYWQPGQRFVEIQNNNVRTVSEDGEYAAGRRNSLASRWSAATGWVDIGELPGGSVSALVRDISADGTVVVGESHTEIGIPEAFRWEEGGAMEGLGVVPPGYSPGDPAISRSWSTNGDGSIIVGMYSEASGPRAFIWTESLGMRDLEDYLSSDLGVVMTGWSLIRATGISKDGRVVVGHGSNPTDRNGWVILDLSVP